MNGKDKLIAELEAQNEKLRKKLHELFSAEAFRWGATAERATKYSDEAVRRVLS